MTYEGNGLGGASRADIVAVERFDSYETTLANSTFHDTLFGAFGPTIASTSSASECINGVSGSNGPVTPSNSFDLSATFSMNSTGGLFVIDPTFTSNFGAGSPIGSFIVYGQTTALLTPEPNYFGLVPFVLGAIITLRSRRSRVSIWA